MTDHEEDIDGSLLEELDSFPADGCDGDDCDDFDDDDDADFDDDDESDDFDDNDQVGESRHHEQAISGLPYGVTFDLLSGEPRACCEYCGTEWRIEVQNFRNLICPANACNVGSVRG